MEVFRHGVASTRGRFAALLAIFTLAVGAGELVALFACAAFGALLGFRQKPNTAPGETPPEAVKTPHENRKVFRAAPFFAALIFLFAALGWFLQAPLFLSFLKIGSVLYGSGYVLLAFLQSEFVPQFLSQRQLLDAVAIGQITPGPVFTAATFVGYQIDGWRGAIAATLGIFLPSFVFVALLSQLLKTLKNSPRTRAFLDCINAASLVLLAYATLFLARGALSGALAIAIFLVALALLFCTKINPAWLLALGALLGFVTKI